jgi:uncharacterized protein
MKEELIEAIKAGDEERVRALIATGEELVNVRSGDTPAVMLAIYHGHRSIALALVAHGADVDIFTAAALGNADRLAILLKGRNHIVNTCSPEGWTPLALASYFGWPPAARLLLSVGADINARSRNDNQNTPLHAAVAGKRQEMVDFLIEAGADLNARDGRGWTPLNLAAHEGPPGLVESLLAAGADPSIPNNDGHTPLQTAERENRPEAAAALRTAFSQSPGNSQSPPLPAGEGAGG